VTTALAASGLPPQPFRFCGFAPRAAGARRAFYAALRDEEATLVCFEAPHRLAASVADAQAELGDRPACLARNLTKPHERYQRGTLGELAAALAAEGTVRGECTLVIAGTDAGVSASRERQAADAARLLLAEGVAPRTVMDLLTRVMDVPRRRAYEMAHRPDEERRG
jgi:16S rRNA (cytidine1402-2'-O)-methyltransferase